MELVTRKLREIHPYPNNPRKNDKSVDAVAESIAQCGYCAPIVIDEDDVILAGHTRYRALKKLGWKECDVCVAAGLTDEQKRKYRILDNRTNELSVWDFDKLDLELPTLDFGGFDFGFGGLKKRKRHKTHEEWKIESQWRVCNILNLAEGNYPGEGKYDIPVLQPVMELPPIKEWIDFSQILQDAEPEGKAVHFFIDDFRFERIWNEPRKYVDKLSRYVCVATPDFSPYGDMPFAAMLWNHYRKHWVGAFLQENGVTVIPTIRASSNPKFDEVWLDGEPSGGIVIMSCMWAKKDEDEQESTRRFYEVVERLKPKKVFIYGHDRRFPLKGAEVEFIDNFTLKRFGS